MNKNFLKIIYKVYLEADDISASRIQSSIHFVETMLEDAGNVYFKGAAIDNESSIEEFTLRYYIENEIHEDSCTSAEDAESFAFDMAEFLDAIAAAHSYMDLEGSLIWEYQGEKKEYRFQSESGMDYCNMTLIDYDK